MAVSCTALYANVLGVVGSGAPATIAFDPTVGAQLLVVTLGWQSNASYAPPLVTFLNEAMVLQSTISRDPAVGVIAVYTLAVTNPGAGNIVVQPPGFLGNTQIHIAAYAGTNQQLAQIVPGEYGTSSSGVNTGTLTLPGVQAGSLSVVAGCTWFGGSPSTLALSGTDGWSWVASYAGSNQTINVAESAATGSLDCTFTDLTNFWTMMVIGYEVLAGTPPSGGGGVSVVHSTVALLGIINAASPQTISFDPGAADFIVATVAWAGTETAPVIPPKVTFNGVAMQVVATPMMVSENYHAVALYALAWNGTAGAVSVTVNSNPNYNGYTSIAVHSFSGSAQLLGQMLPSEFGVHDTPVFTGSATLSGISANSAVVFVGGTLWGTTPTTMTRSTGWADDGNANGTNQSIWAFHQRTPVPPSASITVNSGDGFNLLSMFYEVLVAGTPPPASSVTITNATVVDLGTIGLDTATVNFDAMGADLLLVAAARTNNSYFGPAAYTYGGVKLAMVDPLDVRNLDTSTAMEVAFLARPPSGVQPLAVTGHTGYWGYTTVYLIGLKTLSGVVGVRTAQPISGTSADFALGDSVSGSLLLAFASAIFPKKLVTPNYGWVERGKNLTSPSINAWLWSAVGGPGRDLLLTAESYAAMAGIIVEMQAQVATVPDHVGTGTASMLSSVAVSHGVNLGRLTPSGQDFHVYWETWEDIPNKAVSMLEPDDFYLARIPPVVTHVILSFAIPRFTYTGLTDALKPTTGLNFPGSPALLRQTLDLLRARNPGVKILVAMQQNTPEEAHNEPYDPTGWGGMTDANVASTLLFIRDMALDGVVIDYECLSASIDNSFRCQPDPVTGAVTCYTDAEQLATIKRLRAGLPRPLLLYLDGIHVGAYADMNEYRVAPPVGQNGGYNICVSHDPDAIACLDGIHAMTYDAGATYDPRTAFRAFQEMFPTLKIWLGLRTGPPQWEGVKQTAKDMRDFCATVIKLGGGGVHMYSGMWDVGYIGRYDGAQNQGPFGDYGRDFPDGNVAAAIVTDMFGEPRRLRLNNNHLLQGFMG